MTSKIYKVVKPFTIYQDDERNLPAPDQGQVTSFKQGDVVTVYTEGVRVFMYYKCGLFRGDTGVFSGTQSSDVDPANIQEVSKCQSGFSSADASVECISPMTSVIDNMASGGFMSKPFGMNPILGWGIIIVTTGAIVYGIMKIKK